MVKLVFDQEIHLPKLTIKICLKKSGDKYQGNIYIPDNFKIVKLTYKNIDALNAKVAEDITLAKNIERSQYDPYSTYRPSQSDKLLIDKSAYILMNKLAINLCKYGYKTSSCQGYPQTVKINWITWTNESKSLIKKFTKAAMKSI